MLIERSIKIILVKQNIEKGLARQLNIHGYGFQYSVTKLVKRCSENNSSPWILDVAEFPVVVNGISTHIDFVLRNKNEPFFMVAECKRSDPSLSNWCFVKAPYVSRKINNDERIVREVLINRESSGDPPVVGLHWISAQMKYSG